MNEQQILAAAHARGKADAIGINGISHPGPDQADIADLTREMYRARGVIFFGDELEWGATPFDTSDWSESDWDAHRNAEKRIHRDVGDAYAAGQDEGRKERNR